MQDEIGVGVFVQREPRKLCDLTGQIAGFKNHLAFRLLFTQTPHGAETPFFGVLR